MPPEGTDPTAEAERWTVLIVPERGETRQYVVERRHATWAALGASVMAALALFGVVQGVSGALWRSSEQRLVDENLQLKARLQDVEGSLDQVDDLVRRLRLYEAQLDGLDAGQGPLEADEVEALARGSVSPTGNDDLEAMEEPTGEPLGFDAGDDSLWAGLLVERLDRTLALTRSMEPELEHLLERGEAVRGRLQALPHGWPVDGGVLSSGYGYRRSPFTRRWKFHSGLDIAADRGAPIRVLAPGRVLRAEFDGGYGRMVEVDHGNGVVSRFAHTASSLVQPGDEVRAGQIIATVGSTGASTGPHLHYELDIDGVHVDPSQYLTLP